MTNLTSCLRKINRVINFVKNLSRYVLHNSNPILYWPSIHVINRFSIEHIYWSNK